MYNYTYNNTTLYFPNTAAEIYVRKFVHVDNVKSLDNKLCNDLSLERQVNFVSVKVMLPETIRNDDFNRNTALQHCFEWLQHCCFSLKIVVVNRPV